MRIPLKFLISGLLAFYALGLTPVPDTIQPVPDATAQSRPNKKIAKSEVTAREKRRVEGQRANVEKRLSTLQAEIATREAQSETTAQALRKADQAISKANRKLRDLSAERAKVEADLAGLRQSSAVVADELDRAEDTVAQIARAQFVHSKQNAWQSLINGRPPNELARDGGKLLYLARAQSQAILLLESRQNNIRDVSEKRLLRKQTLMRIHQEEEYSRQELLIEKQDRQKVLAALQSEIKTRQARIDKLEKDRAQLSSLVSSIDARLEKERRIEEAQARLNERATRLRSKQKATPPHKATGHFARLKGKLRLPVKGRIIGRFGQRRLDGNNTFWQGFQIRAPEGTEVGAFAAGKVVFSDWLRGFGNLIIIDHGNSYMSIYANNESLFKNSGDMVHQGDIICSVGSSGGIGKPGLYFELRYRGKPVNPAPWLAQ